MSAVLEAEGLSLRLGGRPRVDAISVAVAAGEMVGLLGPNGAGKTTLFSLLTGERRPDAGVVRLDGAALATLAPWQLAARRAVMAQSTRLAFPLRVVEVVRLGVEGVGRGLDAAARRRLIGAALEQADVAHLAGRDVPTLSGGERQRVHFARVLAQLAAGASVAPRQVLFLDEPVASLDLSHQLALLDAAAALARAGTAVVVILHDLNLAVRYAGRLWVLARGRLVADGPPARVLRDALVERVFDIRIPLGLTPAGDVPFLLPQLHGAARRHAVAQLE